MNPWSILSVAGGAAAVIIGLVLVFNPFEAVKLLSIRIPMAEGSRSLNVSNAAAIVLYEALRQNDFSGLQREGQLHRHV